MKIENYEFPKSGFLSMEKDAGIIISKMLKNERLKKLLFYSDKQALKLPNLDQKQTLTLIDKGYIKLIPKIEVDDTYKTYIVVSFDNFVPNSENPQFRNNTITFDIICHFDQWNLGDFQLRPYKIAGEIDSMFNNKHLTGIGLLQFIGANQIVLSDELAGLSVTYLAIHGEEDKVK